MNIAVDQGWRSALVAASASLCVPLGQLAVRLARNGASPAAELADQAASYLWVWASSTALGVGLTWYFQRRSGAARRLSLTDPLTGLFNRRHFAASLLLEVEQDRTRGLATSVLCLDLDRFKTLNDRYGHGRGDAALVAVAKALSVGVRQRDVVARFGGDEFAILLPGTAAKDAVGIGERILAELNRSDADFGGALSASIGVAELELTGRSGDVLEAADRALYWAKRAGGGCVALAPPADDAVPA